MRALPGGALRRAASAPFCLAVQKPAAQRALALALAAAVFAADQLSKQWAIAGLAGEPPVVVAPFLRWVYAQNTGIAFGWFAGGGDFARALLLAITFALVALFFALMWRARARGEALALALLFGGGAGNLADRAINGYVVDFIDLHWGASHWPAFNIADMAINAGVVLYIVFALLADKGETPRG